MTAKPIDHPLWGIHAGAIGDAHRLFIDHNCVAIGWAAFGDLSQLPATRDVFKAEYNRVYPGTKLGLSPSTPASSSASSTSVASPAPTSTTRP